MTNPEMGPRESEVGEKSEKEMIWEKTRKELDGIGDRLGLGIDEGIKETVTAFKVNGFPTSSSCEGHSDRAIPVPWVDIEALNKPDERFIGQNETFVKVAKKYNLTFEEVKFSGNDDAYWEAVKECSDKETEEYKEWDKDNIKLQTKAQNLLEQFYKNRKVEPNIELKIYDFGGSFRIHNGGEDYDDLIEYEEKVSEERKQKRAEKLVVYKKEMDDFTEFLKQKFFTE